MKKLTDKQKMFCKEYLIDLNATQAAIRAGYSEHTAKDIGCQNLAKLNIQEEISRLMNKRAERLQIDADDILRDIIEVKDRCMQKTAVLERDGDEWVETGEWKFEYNGALKALEMLGKHKKLFTDKVEHSGEIKMPTIVID